MPMQKAIKSIVMTMDSFPATLWAERTTDPYPIIIRLEIMCDTLFSMVLQHIGSPSVSTGTRYSFFNVKYFG